MHTANTLSARRDLSEACQTEYARVYVRPLDDRAAFRRRYRRRWLRRLLDALAAMRREAA